MARSRLRNRWWRLLYWGGLVLCAGAVVGWRATRHRNAWGANGWPRYACVHGGSLMVLSSLWNRPGREADGSRALWMYDLNGPAVNQGRHGTWVPAGVKAPWLAWWPPVRRVGTQYSGGALRWSRPLTVVEVPLWVPAGPGLGLAVFARARGRRGLWVLRGRCGGCGYAMDGLAVCPECGQRA